MRILLLAGLLACIACTKKNPDLCCTDPANCMANNIPEGSTCKDGLVCRGNQCIAEDCASSSGCEAAAPYCVMQLCGSSCTDDMQCPGFGQASNDTFCVNGACVECRAGMNDCPASAPVCDSNACRGCRAHSECASGVCAMDGTCATESDIAYVDPAGSTSSTCSRSMPCTLQVGIATGRSYVLLAGGTYSHSGTITLSGTQSLIGGSATRPTVTNSAAGAIFYLYPPATISLEHLQVSGATSGGTTAPGDGVLGDTTHVGQRELRLFDDVIAQNADDGVYCRACTVTALTTTFSNNSNGLEVADTDATVDRCTAASNSKWGLSFDNGTIAVTNSFVYRNATGGIQIYTQAAATHFDFNTIVDNATGFSGSTGGGVTTMASNNIIARSSTAPTLCGQCTFPGSLVLGSDISSLHFKSPDSAPYDYHLGTGSVAIDGAISSTMDHDFDGDPRPLGNGRDVGADEAQ